MDVDFWGVVNGTKAFLPHLIASGDGHVINISSVFGIFAVPTQSAYNAAKFAVRGFTEALRQEMLAAKRPVKVTCVHPGGIKTNIARNADQAEGRDHEKLSKEFDKLAQHEPRQGGEGHPPRRRAGTARVLVGWDAKAIDAFVRLTGSGLPRHLRTLQQEQGPLEWSTTMTARIDLRGSRALVTGATGGLGQAIARRLAKEGAELVLSGRRLDVLEPLAKELGATAIAADLEDLAEVDRLMEEAGPIDVLVANAALSSSGRPAGVHARAGRPCTDGQPPRTDRHGPHRRPRHGRAGQGAHRDDRLASRARSRRSTPRSTTPRSSASAGSRSGSGRTSPTAASVCRSSSPGSSARPACSRTPERSFLPGCAPSPPTLSLPVSSRRSAATVARSSSPRSRCAPVAFSAPCCRSSPRPSRRRAAPRRSQRDRRGAARQPLTGPLARWGHDRPSRPPGSHPAHRVDRDRSGRRAARQPHTVHGAERARSSSRTSTD